MYKVIGLASVLIAIAVPAPVSAYTQEQQMACQDDAFRLCHNAIPDEHRVKACLIANLSRLSPSCRRIFGQARR